MFLYYVIYDGYFVIRNRKEYKSKMILKAGIDVVQWECENVLFSDTINLNISFKVSVFITVHVYFLSLAEVTKSQVGRWIFCKELQDET